MMNMNINISPDQISGIIVFSLSWIMFLLGLRFVATNLWVDRHNSKNKK